MLDVFIHGTVYCRRVDLKNILIPFQISDSQQDEKLKGYVFAPVSICINCLGVPLREEVLDDCQPVFKIFYGYLFMVLLCVCGERERENLNSNTLFYKDCSLSSFKNLSNN